ncbi:unnamed protein product [Lampetra planeri]
MSKQKAMKAHGHLCHRSADAEDDNGGDDANDGDGVPAIKGPGLRLTFSHPRNGRDPCVMQAGRGSRLEEDDDGGGGDGNEDKEERELLLMMLLPGRDALLLLPLFLLLLLLLPLSGLNGRDVTRIS